MYQEFEPWTKFDPDDKQKKPSWGDPDTWSICPVCQGHTKCIVGIGDVGGYKHVNKKGCLNCGGMFPLGWVRTHCIHDWQLVDTHKNQEYYKCSKCGQKQNLDSGD